MTFSPPHKQIFFKISIFTNFFSISVISLDVQYVSVENLNFNINQDESRSIKMKKLKSNWLLFYSFVKFLVVVTCFTMFLLMGDVFEKYRTCYTNTAIKDQYYEAFYL